MATADADVEDQQSKRNFSTLVGNGKWLLQKGEFKKATESFTEVRVSS